MDYFKTPSVKNIVDWIDFLHKDLLGDFVLIGGFYFTFSMLPEFDLLEQDLNQACVGLSERLKDIHRQLSQTITKEVCGALQQEQSKLFYLLNTISTEIPAFNKQKEKVLIPCMKEEFEHVHETLKDFKADIDYFKVFLEDYLKTGDAKTVDAFLYFVNDLVQELRQKLSGSI